MADPIRIAIIGLGKIARDQHLPAIAADPRFKLVATASTSGAEAGVPSFPDVDALVASGIGLDAVSICTPPGPRPAIARAALEAGLDVLLEKPPTSTLSEFVQLRSFAEEKGRVLFASWHSRFAPMVEPARQWLSGRTIRSGKLRWREDARKWHPGQQWLFAAGGMGVFDPGINGLSILTAISPAPVVVRKARLDIPENGQAPVAVQMTLAAGAAEIACDLDFRETSGEVWEITLETDGGTLHLRAGGAAMQVDDGPEQRAEPHEYPGLYVHFAELIASRQPGSDPRPLVLVADAFMIAETRRVEPFSV